MSHLTALPSRVPVQLPEPGPRPGTPVGATAWACVMCFRSAAHPGGCCSATCAGEARRELRRNTNRLQGRRLGHDVATTRWLAERNGRLSSALLRWGPGGQRSTQPSPVGVATARSAAAPPFEKAPSLV
jgi:hypothetical protein